MAKKEVWKDISGYEGIYQISNYGRIKSLSRFDTIGRRIQGKMLKVQTNADGYFKITLCHKSDKKTFLVHRLVALHFIPNPFKLPEVNHKDVNVANNYAENLEWCDRLYNANYDNAHLKTAEKNKKAVIQMDLDGKFIKRWSSIKEATEAVKIPDTNIKACCKKEKYRHTAGGYKWKYAEDE